MSQTRQYICTGTINLDGKWYEPGDTISLTKEQAARQLSIRFIKERHSNAPSGRGEDLGAAGDETPAADSTAAGGKPELSEEDGDTLKTNDAAGDDTPAADSLGEEILLNQALFAGIVSRTGSWLRFGEIPLGNGQARAVAFLAENPGIVSDIREKLADVKPDQNPQ